MARKLPRKCCDYFYLVLGLLHGYSVICDFGFVLISIFVILGWSLRGPMGQVWVQQKKKKTCLLNWSGLGNGYGPGGRVWA